jgi:predicted regulator of Ras-like GTPase activity (Roadblock/LC7/MglB family)
VTTGAISTPFTPMLQRVIERVPGAIGAIFADWDGEAVDLVSKRPREDLLYIGAHYGVILNNVQALLRLFHFGEAVEIVIQHDKVDLCVRAVGDGYYVVLALAEGGHLATALREARLCADSLRREMY